MDNTKNDPQNNKPLSSASERLRYQVKHFDMMGDLASAAGTVRRNGLYATPADVSPELANVFRAAIENSREVPHELAEAAQYWLEPVPATPSLQSPPMNHASASPPPSGYSPVHTGDDL